LLCFSVNREKNRCFFLLLFFKGKGEDFRLSANRKKEKKKKKKKKNE